MFAKYSLAASACLLACAPAHAQQAGAEPVQDAVPAPAPAAPVWTLTVGAGQLSAARGHASDRSVSLRHVGPWGSLALERLQLQRFGTSDAATALDAYPWLWQGAYANVRVQSSDHASLYPRRVWRAELYQNLPGDWEVSASRDALGFDSPVQIDGLALARYWGNFYVRWRHQTVTSDSASGKGDRLVLRYYYAGDADHHLEVSASRGRSVDATGTAITSNLSSSQGVSWLHHFHRAWGLRASATQSHDTSGSNARERAASLSAIYRW